jgi:hypothetical protein
MAGPEKQKDQEDQKDFLPDLPDLFVSPFSP